MWTSSDPFGTTALPYLGDFAGSSQTPLSGCHSHKPGPNPYKCSTYPVGLIYGNGAGRVCLSSALTPCRLPHNRFTVDSCCMCIA